MSVKQISDFLSEWKKGYLWLACLGIFLYMQITVNLLPNPDAIWNRLYYKEGYNWENSLGRWGLRCLAKLKGYAINPTVATVFSILLLSFAVMLVCRLFHVRGTFSIFMIGAVIIASPNIVNTLTYYYCADFYMAAYFFAVLAAYIICKKRGFLWGGVAALLIAASLSLYQAYITIAIVVCLGILLVKVLDVRKESSLDIARLAARMCVVGGGGILGYLISTKVLQKLWNFSLTDGRGFSQMGKIDIVQLPNQIISCYRNFYCYFFTDDLLNNSWLGRKYVNVFIFLTLLIAVAVLIFQNKNHIKIAGIVVIAGIMLVFPVAFLAMNIAAPEVSIHESTGILLIPAMNYFYVLWFVLLQKAVLGNKTQKVGNVCLLIGGLSIIWILIQFVGVFQTCMEINLRKTCSVAEEICYDVDNIPGYDEYSIVIGGNVDLGNEELYDVVRGTVAEYGAVWDTDGRNKCWAGIFDQYFSKSYNFCNYDEYLNIIESEEYLNMTLYPEEGSLKIIDQYIVIKLSD